MLEIKEPWLSLRTNHFGAMLEFYEHLLGAPFQVKLERYAYFRLGSIKLVIWQDKQTCVAEQTLQVVLCVDHLEQSIASLPENCVVSDLRQESHGKELEFSDPDGNRILLYQPTTDFSPMM